MVHPCPFLCPTLPLLTYFFSLHPFLSSSLICPLSIYLLIFPSPSSYFQAVHPFFPYSLSLILHPHPLFILILLPPHSFSFFISIIVLSFIFLFSSLTYISFSISSLPSPESYIPPLYLFPIFLFPSLSFLHPFPPLLHSPLAHPSQRKHGAGLLAPTCVPRAQSHINASSGTCERLPCILTSCHEVPALPPPSSSSVLRRGTCFLSPAQCVFISSSNLPLLIISCPLHPIFLHKS